MKQPTTGNIGPKNPPPDKLHDILHSMDDQCLFALNDELQRLYAADVGMASIAWRIYGAIIYEAERREREQC